MSATAYKLCFAFGIISLLHAAYSSAQHRAYLRLVEQEFFSLPTDIIVQSLISLFIAMYGLLHIAGDFKEIRAAMELEMKSWENVGNRPSFYTFSHRGRVLSTYRYDE